MRFTNKRAVNPIEKTLKSAVANMRTSQGPESIYVKEAYVGQGPSLKRMRPRAFGRAAGYTRKTCHITIEVEELQV